VHEACRDTAALAAASQIDLCLSTRPAPRPNKAQITDVCIDLTVDPPCAKDRTLRRQSVDIGRVANVYGSMNWVGTKRARDASARSTFRAAFGTVDQEQFQIDGKKHTNVSFDIVGDCDDLVRGSGRPATREEQQAFAQNFHTAPCKHSRKSSGPRNRLFNDAAQPLATSFLDSPRDMQPPVQHDEPQARKITVGARTDDTVCADTGLSASSEAQHMSLAAHFTMPQPQVIVPVFGLSPSALTLPSDLAPCARVCLSDYVVMEQLTRKPLHVSRRVVINRTEVGRRRTVAQLRRPGLPPARASEHPSPSPCCIHMQSATRQ